MNLLKLDVFCLHGNARKKRFSSRSIDLKLNPSDREPIKNDTEQKLYRDVDKAENFCGEGVSKRERGVERKVGLTSPRGGWR